MAGKLPRTEPPPSELREARRHTGLGGWQTPTCCRFISTGELIYLFLTSERALLGSMKHERSSKNAWTPAFSSKSTRAPPPLKAVHTPHKDNTCWVFSKCDKPHSSSILFAHSRGDLVCLPNHISYHNTFISVRGNIILAWWRFFVLHRT